MISADVLSTLTFPKFHKPSKWLCGPDRKPLDVIDEFPVTLSYKDKSCVQPAIQALNLLTQVDTLEKTPVPEQFPGLFTGLGTIQESFEIKLKPDAQPFALFTPCNVPISLRKKVRDELTRMESLRVISCVETPTPWCAGMVVVPKKYGHMCGLQTFEQACIARGAPPAQGR